MATLQFVRRKILKTSPAFLRSFLSTYHASSPVELASLVASPLPTAIGSHALIILHGLFGSKRNWTSLQKTFHRALPQHSIHTLDLRNHGASPHATPMTYTTMAEDVLHYINSHDLKNITLLGHSMGGKVAMTVALLLAKSGQMNILSHLLISDIAPIHAELSADFVKYIDAMSEVNALPHGAVRTRTEADRILYQYESDLAIRQFLLTNLVLPSPLQSLSKPHFGLPLDVLRRSIPDLGSFPYDLNDPARPKWNGKTLVFRGSKSLYIDDSNRASFKHFFPNSTMVELETGHWVHAEKPNEFKDLVIKFIQS